MSYFAYDVQSSNKLKERKLRSQCVCKEKIVYNRAVYR